MWLLDQFLRLHLRSPLCVCHPSAIFGREDVMLNVRTLETELAHILFALTQIIRLELLACGCNHLAVKLYLGLQE